MLNFLIIVPPSEIAFFFRRCTGKAVTAKDGGDQQREYFRVDVPEPETLSVNLKLEVGDLTGCKLLNIGIGGAAILAVQQQLALKIGSKIKVVSISFPGGAELRASAVVKYVVRESDSAWNKYGIEFDNLSDEQGSIIARYVLQTEAEDIRSHRVVPTE